MLVILPKVVVVTITNLGHMRDAFLGIQDRQDALVVFGFCWVTKLGIAFCVPFLDPV